MFSFSTSFSFLSLIWTSQSLTTMNCGTPDNCNQQFIFDKTYSDSVTFNCNSPTDCSSLIIYWAAPSPLTINCMDDVACKDIDVFCGYWDPPGQTHTLSDMDTSIANSIDCYINCDETEAGGVSSCLEIYFGCKGSAIRECEFGGFSTNQIQDSDMECDVVNIGANVCELYCTEGCVGTSLLCHTGSVCDGTGVGYTVVNDVTYEPTTYAPTITAIPTTAMPTISPITSEPTTVTPTTAVPTTATPTTAVPTTALPTTDNPTNVIPTTAIPTSMIPTTVVPTVPTTYIPTSSPPTIHPSIRPSKQSSFNPTIYAPTTSNPTLRISPTHSPISETEQQQTILVNGDLTMIEGNGSDLVTIIAIIAGLIGFISIIIALVFCYRIRANKQKNKENNIEMADTPNVSRVLSVSAVNSDIDCDEDVIAVINETDIGNDYDDGDIIDQINATHDGSNEKQTQGMPTMDAQFNNNKDNQTNIDEINQTNIGTDENVTELNGENHETVEGA